MTDRQTFGLLFVYFLSVGHCLHLSESCIEIIFPLKNVDILEVCFTGTFLIAVFFSISDFIKSTLGTSMN